MLFLLNVSQIKRQHCQNPPYRNNINMHTRPPVDSVSWGQPRVPYISRNTKLNHCGHFFSYIKLSLLVRMLYFVGNKTFSKIVMNDLFLWLSVLHRTFRPLSPKSGGAKREKRQALFAHNSASLMSPWRWLPRQRAILTRQYAVTTVTP